MSRADAFGTRMPAVLAVVAFVAAVTSLALVALPIDLAARGATACGAPVVEVVGLGSDRVDAAELEHCRGQASQRLALGVVMLALAIGAGMVHRRRRGDDRFDSSSTPA